MGGVPLAGVPLAELRPVTIWTVGHSTRTANEFFEVLRAFEIECVLDVRRFPGSRRHPHFESGTLERSLNSAGIDYYWIQALGGRRAGVKATPSAWRHRAFSAYAEHGWSEEFAEGLMELVMIAAGLRSAIMCAEVLWWRCHRRIIADVLTSLDVPVVHIRTATVSETHRLAPPARLVDGHLTYAPPDL